MEKPRSSSFFDIVLCAATAHNIADRLQKSTLLFQMMNEMNQDAALLKEMMNILMERQLHYMKEFLSFIRDTPQQRYLNLLREKPQLIQRVPQHYIASYLGITSVHLSRIKNKILKEKHS